EQIAALPSAGSERGAGRDGILLAAGQLAAASARGASVAAELATLRAGAGDDAKISDIVGRLQPFAGRPVPTQDALATQFAVAADAALRADPSRLSAPRMLGDTPAADWLDGVLRRLS